MARSERIKKLNNEIKTHFHTKMKKKVRRIIVPGNNQSLWKAVKIAKDINTNDLPKAMFAEGQRIEVLALTKRVLVGTLYEYYNNKRQRFTLMKWCSFLIS